MLQPTEPTSGHTAPQDHYQGNADDIGAEQGGWFMEPNHCECHPMLAGNDVKLKWGKHTAGEPRKQWDQGLTEWSLSVLIEGDFSIEFKDEICTLRNPGDFVVWRPGVPHTWRANSKSVVLTVRWRARAGSHSQSPCD